MLEAIPLKFWGKAIFNRESPAKISINCEARIKICRTKKVYLLRPLYEAVSKPVKGKTWAPVNSWFYPFRQWRECRDVWPLHRITRRQLVLSMS